LQDRPKACDAALAAALGAPQGRRNNAAAGGRGQASHGKVFYGNVGNSERLDFTVIEPAVNEATRIAGMYRSVGQPVLVSASFAAVGDMKRRLLSVGRYALRGVSHPQELFRIDPEA
jgi:adenylate cyclase